MSHKNPLAAGEHDAESAAIVLDMSKIALLKRMRELGWLYADQDRRNLPREEFKRAGWLNTQTRTHGLRGEHKNIGRQYQVMILTAEGFNHLKRALAGEVITPPKRVKVMPPPSEHSSKIERPFNRERSNSERQQALKQLQEWNLA